MSVIIVPVKLVPLKLIRSLAVLGCAILILSGSVWADPPEPPYPNAPAADAPVVGAPVVTTRNGGLGSKITEVTSTLSSGVLKVEKFVNNEAGDSPFYAGVTYHYPNDVRVFVFADATTDVTQIYYPEGTMVTIYKNQGFDSSPNEGGRAEYTEDENGHLKVIRIFGPDGNRTAIKRFQYDEDGLLRRDETIYDEPRALRRVVDYRDENQIRSRLIDHNNRTIYDSDTRPSGEENDESNFEEDDVSLNQPGLDDEELFARFGGGNVEDFDSQALEFVSDEEGAEPHHESF